MAEILNRFPYARIGMVTFTRAATDSLSEKLKKKLTKEKLDRIKINTFHGFVKMQLDEMEWTIANWKCLKVYDPPRYQSRGNIYGSKCSRVCD